MGLIRTDDGTEIFYKDRGRARRRPSSWPLSADDWDNQMMFFLRQEELSLRKSPRQFFF